MKSENFIVFYNSASQLIIGKKVAGDKKPTIKVKNPAYLHIDVNSEGALVSKIVPLFLNEWMRNPSEGITVTYSKSSVAIANDGVLHMDVIANYKSLFGANV